MFCCETKHTAQHLFVYNKRPHDTFNAQMWGCIYKPFSKMDLHSLQCFSLPTSRSATLVLTFHTHTHTHTPTQQPSGAVWGSVSGLRILQCGMGSMYQTNNLLDWMTPLYLQIQSRPLELLLYWPKYAFYSSHSPQALRHPICQSCPWQKPT